MKNSLELRTLRARVWACLLLAMCFGAGEANGEREKMTEEGVSSVSSGRPIPSWQTRKNARVYSLLIPAARGQISARNGVSLAQTKVLPNLGLKLPSGGEWDPRSLKRWARNALMGVLSEEDIEGIDYYKMIQHQQNRPVLPFVVRENFQAKGESLTTSHSYSRYYPQKKSAAHIIGYTGKTAPPSARHLENGDLFFPEEEGRDGIEMIFNEFLRGEYGKINIYANEDGELVSEKIEIAPRPGASIITTLDIGVQKFCEEELEKGGRAGAVVVIETLTGDIVAMASHPSFDLNLFSPRITQENYRKLTDDPASPLFGRAFQAAYPPGSTFKTFVGMGVLESGMVDETTLLNCPNGLKIGNIFFRNHSGDMGNLTLGQAMARSCNTWFYQVGLAMGADPILHWARAVGFGRKTGILVPGENGGLVPDNEFMRNVHNRNISRGDIANLSIGQGDLLVSPLQMAHAMSVIANRGVILRPRLIRQIQDIDNSVKSAYPVRQAGRVSISDRNLQILTKALVLVTAGGEGTGRRAATIKNVNVAGKTGTSQWGPTDKRKNIAWFAGFAPAEDPKYAFAVMIEGKPREGISGGKTAAPLAGKLISKLLSDYQPKIPASPQDEEAESRGEGGDDLGLDEDVVDYSDLLTRFVEEIEDEEGREVLREEPLLGAEPIEPTTEKSENDERGRDSEQPSYNRTYDYIPEGIGRILE